MKNNNVLMIIALILVSFCTVGYSFEEEIGNCSGCECDGDFQVTPVGNFSVYIGASGITDGKGKGGPEMDDCDVCFDCKAPVNWSYTGSGQWHVGNDRGNGPASGAIEMVKACHTEGDGTKHFFAEWLWIPDPPPGYWGQDSLFWAEFKCLCGQP